MLDEPAAAQSEPENKLKVLVNEIPELFKEHSPPEQLSTLDRAMEAVTFSKAHHRFLMISQWF